MRTTIDIDLKLLAEAEEISGEKSPSRVVNKALSEYVRRRKLEELRAMIGKLGLTSDWRMNEEVELQEMNRISNDPDRHVRVD